MSNKEYNDDDGRIVSDMTYTQKTTWYESFSSLTDRKDKKPRKMSLTEANITLSREETRSYIRSALAASLLVTGIFIGTFYIFILFCIHIWFK